MDNLTKRIIGGSACIILLVLSIGLFYHPLHISSEAEGFTGQWRDVGLDAVRKLSPEDKVRMAMKVQFNRDGTGIWTMGGSPKASQSPLEPQSMRVTYKIKNGVLNMEVPGSLGAIQFGLSKDHDALVIVNIGKEMTFVRANP